MNHPCLGQCLLLVLASVGSSVELHCSVRFGCLVMMDALISAALFQFISSMEIMHALVGIVRGSPAAALLQWTGRANVLYAVILAIPEITSSRAAGAMVLAWAISEVIRYPWYAAQLTGQCPFWLTWLRYTMFIPLYPIGVLGEIISIYHALPVLQDRKMYSIEMPNSFNFSFSYATFMKVCVRSLVFLNVFLAV